MYSYMPDFIMCGQTEILLNQLLFWAIITEYHTIDHLLKNMLSQVYSSLLSLWNAAPQFQTQKTPR